MLCLILRCKLIDTMAGSYTECAYIILRTRVLGSNEVRETRVWFAVRLLCLLSQLMQCPDYLASGFIGINHDIICTGSCSGPETNDSLCRQ